MQLELSDIQNLKTSLLNQLIQSLEEELKRALMAAQSARNGSTHEDAGAKSKYETQATELSYLADGQAMRAKSLSEQLYLIKQFKCRDFNAGDPVGVGSVIHIDFPKTKQSTRYFIVAIAGKTLSFENTEYVTLSPNSPFGSQVIGCFLEDEIEYKNGIITKIY